MSSTDSSPVVSGITRHNGVADQFSYSATVQYDDDTAPSTVTFVGNTSGGPIVMVTENYPKGTFVSSRVTDRIGRTLSAEWVRKFFAPKEA